MLLMTHMQTHIFIPFDVIILLPDLSVKIKACSLKNIMFYILSFNLSQPVKAIVDNQHQCDH